MEENRSYYRLLNRDGTFNVVRSHRKRFTIGDLYHSFLSYSWSRFLGSLIVTYLLVNTLFALAYLACGPEALDGLDRYASRDRFFHAFFFSVQTLATIGYGKISPVGLMANIVVTLEALVGLLGLALATGLLFARFARPTARVLFSNLAIIAEHEGVSSLLFRMANERLNQIVEARVWVSLAIDEVTIEGEEYRTFYDLTLERSVSPIFAASWTVVHPITKQSPLYGKSNDDLLKANAEIIVTLSGIDDTFSQTIHSRYSYTPFELLWDRRFRDIFCRSDDGKVFIDLEKIHDVL